MQPSICLSALNRAGFTIALRISSRLRPALSRQLDMPTSRAMTPLAIDAFRKRPRINGFGERLLVSGRNSRIGVVAEHAIVGDRAAETVMVRPIVARVHRPVAALLGVPSQRQFDQRIGARSVADTCARDCPTP